MVGFQCVVMRLLGCSEQLLDIYLLAQVKRGYPEFSMIFWSINAAVEFFHSLHHPLGKIISIFSIIEKEKHTSSQEGTQIEVNSPKFNT